MFSVFLCLLWMVNQIFFSHFLNYLIYTTFSQVYVLLLIYAVKIIIILSGVINQCRPRMRYDLPCMVLNSSLTKCRDGFYACNLQASHGRGQIPCLKSKDNQDKTVEQLFSSVWLFMIIGFVNYNPTQIVGSRVRVDNLGCRSGYLIYIYQIFSSGQLVEWEWDDFN